MNQQGWWSELFNLKKAEKSNSSTAKFPRVSIVTFAFEDSKCFKAHKRVLSSKIRLGKRKREIKRKKSLVTRSLEQRLTF